MLLQIHIVAGALAMILGAVALVARKGAKVHRRSGQLFVCSMLMMGITASVLGPIANGLMPAYFVVTALTTVRAVTAWTRWVNVSALLVAVVLALGSMAKGFTAFGTPGRTLNGVPFFMLFFIGTVMAIAAAGDVRVMWSGPLRGGPRLARHLWRMCFGLFIAAGSFFSVRERVAKNPCGHGQRAMGSSRSRLTVLAERTRRLAANAVCICLVFKSTFSFRTSSMQCCRKRGG